MDQKLPEYPRLLVENGVATTGLSTWKNFDSFVKVIGEFPHYIFRGHRRADWRLEPTLARELKDQPEARSVRQRHLADFMFAARGRRGGNPPSLSAENDWWALGQHNGLATPLLDWTVSPFVALFFAFEEQDSSSDSKYRIVFGLDEAAITEKCNSLVRSDSDLVEFYRPLTDENQRLVNQAGLFTKSPENIDIETWIQIHFDSSSPPVLFKVYIPNNEREACLVFLNRMNINHSTLFPDLYGSSQFSNFKLKIPGY